MRPDLADLVGGFETLPELVRQSNGLKSKTRARVEPPFAHQKGPMGMTLRTIGRARAHVEITLAKMAYNMKRWRWLDGRTAPA